MKRALVISGGGSKGAFAVGVLKNFRALYPNLHFDMVIGTSTGALVTPFATIGLIDELEQIYTRTTTENIITKHNIGDRLNQESIFDATPLWNLIKANLSDDRYNLIVKSNCHMYVVTTCLQTERTVVYTTNPAPNPVSLYSIKRIKDATHMRLTVLASACQPVFMQPVQIDFNYDSGSEKNYQYVDGGVREYAGIQMAIDQGASEIFCILLSPDSSEIVNTKYTSILELLQRSIDMMIEDVSKNDLLIPQHHLGALRFINGIKEKMVNDGVPQNKIDEYFKIGTGNDDFKYGDDIKLYIIRPDNPLGGGPGGLVFDPDEMKRMVSTGITSAQAFANNIKAGDVTWIA